MRGHERLIEYRLKGKAPRLVFVNDYPCKTDWHENPGDAVTICTHGDPIETLDLRFLVGLRVSISTPSEKRAKTLFERVKKAGASAVAVCHVQTDRKPWEQNGYAETWSRNG